MPESKTSKASEILAKLEELTNSLRRRPAVRDEDEDTIDPADKRALTGRLSVVTAQRRTAEEAAASALKLAADLRGAHAEELAALRAEAAVSVTAGVRRVEQNYALRAAMLEPDDDGVATAHRLYDAIPDNRRPDNIVEWWRGLTPEAAPKTLRAYIAAESTGGSGTTGTTVASRQPPKVDVGRGKAADPDPSKMDAAQYDAWLEGMARQRESDRMA